MRVAIAGAGNVGLHVANALRRSGQDVLLIEQDASVIARAITEPGVEWHQGDACEVSSLRDAHLETCDVLVAATGDDEDNLVVGLLRQPGVRDASRHRTCEPPEERVDVHRELGVDLFVSVPSLLTALVEEAVSVGKLVELLQFERGLARLVEVTLAADSPVVDRQISDLELPREVTFVAVLREDHLVVPRGDTVFEVGDEVMALVTPDSEDELRELLTGA